MPSARRWSVSDGRKLISALLLIAAVFLVCVSVGARSWVVAALGVALFAAGIAFFVVSALNSREFAYIPGTAHVVSCSPPPASASQGRCEMHLVVHTPGQDDVAVKIRDAGVPVAKWPDAGATLPILVAVGDPRRVRVLWDRIRTHSEVAEAREQEAREPEYGDQEYPADVAQEGYLDDILDDEEVFDEEPAVVDLGPGGRVIELDVHNPNLFRSEPAREATEGPGESPGIQLDVHTALSRETELAPGAGFAGPAPDPDVPTVPDNGRRVSDDGLTAPDEVRAAEPATEAAVPEAAVPEAAVPEPPAPDRPARRRPSPRPRPPLDDQGPVPAAPAASVGSVTTLHQPGLDEHDAWRPPAAVPAASEWAPAVPSLRVRHLLAPDPAVPGIPTPADAADADVSDAYLSVSTPPGQPSANRVSSVGVTLFVANLGRSVAFYRDVLGFRQVEMGLGSAVLESGDGRIVLRRVVDMAPVDRRLVHLLLEVPDVQAAYDELLLQGVEFVHRPRPVSRYEQLELWSAAFRDPDGHGVALTKWEVQPDDD